MSKRYVRFIDPGIIVQPGGSKGGGHAVTSSYAETASFAHTASYALEALSASYAISASYEIVKEISSSYADTASFALTASYAENAQGVFTPVSNLIAKTDRNIEITGSLATSGYNSDWNIATGGGLPKTFGLRTFNHGIRTVGSIYIEHQSLGDGATARLFLGTTNTGMDIVRLSDSTLVLGGVTQNYGWRLFGIKHGLNSSTYTTEIDNLIATGSTKILGDLDIKIPSGSAFTIHESDMPQDERFDFSFEQGNPILEIIGRQSTASLSLKTDLNGNEFLLTSNGFIKRNIAGDPTTYGVEFTSQFKPIDNLGNVDLGYFNRRWGNLWLNNGDKISFGPSASPNQDKVSIRHIENLSTLQFSGSSDVILDVKGAVSASKFTAHSGSSALTPSYTFHHDNGTGMYSSGPGDLQFQLAGGGTPEISLSTGQMIARVDLAMVNHRIYGVTNITASGNVSSSATSTASFGTYLGDGSQLTGLVPFPFSGSASITGSLLISGSVDIAIPSGSAFTITETDKNPPHDSRLDFFFDNGDPTLEIEGRSSVAKIVLSNNDGDTNNLKIQSDGQIFASDSVGPYTGSIQFLPNGIEAVNVNGKTFIGSQTRPFNKYYTSVNGGQFVCKTAYSLTQIIPNSSGTGTQRIDGFYNGSSGIRFVVTGSTVSGGTGYLRNPNNVYFQIQDNSTGTGNDASIPFRVCKSGSLAINLNQSKGFGFTQYYTASAMVHVEAEPNFNLNLFQGNDITGNKVFEVDREGVITTKQIGITSSAGIGFGFPGGGNETSDVNIFTDVPGEINFFNSGIKAMGINSLNPQGQGTIFIDPAYSFENFQVNHITASSISTTSSAGIGFGTFGGGNEDTDISIFTNVDGEISFIKNNQHVLDILGNNKVRISSSYSLHIDGGSITASAGISSSGDLYARDGRFSRDGGAAEIEILASEVAGGIIGTHTSDHLHLRRFNQTKFTIEENKNISLQKLVVTGSLTISGSLLNTGTVSIDDNDSPYTITGTKQFILIDPQNADVTVNIPSAATYPGRQIFFKLTQLATPNIVTLQCQGADTIDGASTYTDLDEQFEAISIVSNGDTGWFIF